VLAEQGPWRFATSGAENAERRPAVAHPVENGHRDDQPEEVEEGQGFARALDAIVNPG
jgi:hypothetical protein